MSETAILISNGPTAREEGILRDLGIAVIHHWDPEDVDRLCENLPAFNILIGPCCRKGEAAGVTMQRCIDQVPADERSAKLFIVIDGLAERDSHIRLALERARECATVHYIDRICAEDEKLIRTIADWRAQEK